jgi:ribonuclease P protein component
LRHRIRCRTEFEQTFRAQKRANTWFAVYARENEHGISRLGIAVSKKIMPTAVSRNLAKRLIREMFRLEFSAEKAMDLVIVPRRAIKPETLPAGRQALRQLLQGV